MMKYRDVEAPGVPIIDLSDAPGEHQAWDRPKHQIYLWALAEQIFVYNPFQISSSLRVWILRKFGATIGNGVVFRPRCRVKFPWKLTIGDRSWIGEGVWIHNQDFIHIGHDVVISQEAFLTTGSHAHRKDMALITKPIKVHSGAWITSRCIVLGGSDIGISSVIGPGQVVSGTIPSNTVVRLDPVVSRTNRFKDDSELSKYKIDPEAVAGIE